MRKDIAIAAAAAITLTAVCLAGPVGAADPEPSAVAASNAARAVAAPVLDRLDAAWNAADGARFAAEFTEDADVINIFGAPFHGRPDIARRMQLIFDRRFKGSVHKARVLEAARFLTPDMVLVVSAATIGVPQGPDLKNRQTSLLVIGRDGWRIQHWHNTTVSDPDTR